MFRSPCWSGGIADELSLIPIEPPPPADLWDLRLDTAQAEVFLDAVDGDPARLAALRDVRVILNISDPATEIADAQEIMSRCTVRGIRVAPGFALCGDPGNTSIADTWCNRAVWDERATWLSAVSAGLHGFWTEDFVHFDISPYYGAAEPDATALLAVGLTPVDLENAMRPFLDAVAELANDLRMRPYVYPNANAGDLAPPLITRAAGDRGIIGVPAYDAPTEYRNDPTGEYWILAGEHMGTIDEIRTRHGEDVEVAPGFYDDALRAWSGEFRTDYSNISSRPGFILPTEDDLEDIGTADWHIGTTLNVANDAEFVWYCPPFNNLTIARSFGLGASIPLTAMRGSATTLGTNGDPSSAFDRGFKLLRPGSPFTFRCIRGNAAMPTASSPNGANEWGVRIKFQLPADPDPPSEVIGSHPIYSQATSNIEVWQLYYDQANDEIRVVVRAGGSNTTYTVLVTPPREETISIYVGRNGNTEWVFGTESGIDRETLGATAADWEHLMIGAGQDPATTFGTNDQADGMDNLLIAEDVVVWHRNLSDAEIADVLVGNWPWLS